MTTYTDPFTAQTISPSQVAYESLTISTNTYLTWPVNGNTSFIAANIIEVTATTAGLSLLMPNAQQVSVGQAVIVRNIGSIAFTVTDNAGTTIINIPPGTPSTSINTYYIYLTNNSTSYGTWANIAMGAGTSSASASTLAGYGLIALANTLNQAYNVTTLYSGLLLSAQNRATFFVWAGGVGTISLPSSSVVGNNWFVMIKNNGSGILTISPGGSDTIDGNSSQQLQLGESLVLVSNGSSGFDTYGYGRSNTFAYTQLALTVTGGTTTLTSTQAANTIQEYSGTLTSNQIIILPSTVQVYIVTNSTSGAYTLTFKTTAVGASVIAVPQNQTITIACDGTNVYSANTYIASGLSSITVNPGSAASPSINFTGNLVTGFYQPASNQIGFTANGSSVGIVTSSGWQLTAGVVGGAF